MKNKKWIGLVGWILLCYAVAFVASQFEPGPWFRQLDKPTWNPPDWIFAPVWTTLYTMMGVAAWLVWWKGGGFRQAGVPLTLFLIHLLFNGAWSFLFFRLHLIGTAFIDIVLLWMVILVMISSFWSRSRLAGGLMIPYLLWVTFAAILNFSIWQMNT